MNTNHLVRGGPPLKSKARHQMISPAEFERKRNDAHMLNRIFSIMQEDRSERFFNESKSPIILARLQRDSQAQQFKATKEALAINHEGELRKAYHVKRARKY